MDLVLCRGYGVCVGFVCGRDLRSGSWPRDTVIGLADDRPSFSLMLRVSRRPLLPLPLGSSRSLLAFSSFGLAPCVCCSPWSLPGAPLFSCPCRVSSSLSFPRWWFRRSSAVLFVGASPLSLPPGSGGGGLSLVWCPSVSSVRCLALGTPLFSGRLLLMAPVPGLFSLWTPWVRSLRPSFVPPIALPCCCV